MGAIDRLEELNEQLRQLCADARKEAFCGLEKKIVRRGELIQRGLEEVARAVRINQTRKREPWPPYNPAELSTATHS